jgi:pimeloyl-ACP methyl ester carboxylesterase
MTGTKATALDRYCAARFQAFLRFDYRGHGRSGGRFEDGTIGAWLDDVLAVIDRLTEGPQLLVGSSLGGWLAILAALARPRRIAGLVMVAPAVDFTEALIWARLDAAQRKEMVTAGRLVVPSAYDPAGYPITQRLIEEGRRHLLLDAPIPLDIPIRILHGMGDSEVPWQHSLRLAEALTGRDVVVSLTKEGDHRLSTEADLARLAAAVATLSDTPGAAPPDPPDRSDSAA